MSLENCGPTQRNFLPSLDVTYMHNAKQMIANPAPSPNTVNRDCVVSSQLLRVKDSSIKPSTVSDGNASKITIKSQSDCCPLG